MYWVVFDPPTNHHPTGVQGSHCSSVGSNDGLIPKKSVAFNTTMVIHDLDDDWGYPHVRKPPCIFHDENMMVNDILLMIMIMIVNTIVIARRIMMIFIDTSSTIIVNIHSSYDCIDRNDDSGNPG